MNIFYLDADPIEAAKMQCDKHVVKMPTECAQLLCTAHAAFGLPAPWKATHINHPCAKWARENAENYAWLVMHGHGLCEEYTYRYGREHAAHSVILWAAREIKAIQPLLPVGNFSPPPLLTRAQLYYKPGETIVAINRAYYIGDKGHFARWKHRQTPAWFANAAKELV